MKFTQDVEASGRTQGDYVDLAISTLRSKPKLALAAFWLCIQGGYYAPRENASFNHWRWPPVNLEFDHQGDFRRVGSMRIHYEGGETKSSYKGLLRIYNVSNSQLYRQQKINS